MTVCRLPGALISFLLCPVFLVSVQPGVHQNGQSQIQDEETTDYYKKWLEEDVVYIITGEEKDVFQSLATPLEKEQFIEQFWRRRDTDPATSENEFKVEHYRRIAYANERFASGYPGWLTDRGRVYITFGEPDEIVNHSSGETYDRPLYEGGGTTNTYPFQVWRYRYIEGIGPDVELEFVDRTLSGEYRLAISADEKDALLHVGPSGPTLLERLELSKRTERGTMHQDLGFAREEYSSFARFERYAKVFSPPEIEYSDLKEIVEVNTQYVDLPFFVGSNYIQLNEQQVLVLVSIQVENRLLDFQSEGGAQAARLAVYGVVTDLAKRVVYEFDDDLETRHDTRSPLGSALRSSVYQRIIPVDRKTRYKLSLVVKDLNSEKIGVAQEVIIPPPFSPNRLTSSSLILSDSIYRVTDPEAADEMFVLGDLKVRPNLSGEFSRDDPLGVYLQIHNAEIDSMTGSVDLAVTYQLRRGDQVLFEIVDQEGESIQFQSEARVVLVRRFKLQKLEPGNYVVRVRTLDRLAGTDLTAEERFKVVDSR